MSCIIADGFDDRFYISNGSDFEGTWPDTYNGWDLYDEMYYDDWELSRSGGREEGRYGGWVVSPLDDRMYQSATSLEHNFVATKAICGGMAFRGVSNSDPLGIGNATSGVGLTIYSSGRIVATYIVGYSTVDVESRYTCRMTNWLWHYLTFDCNIGDPGADYLKVWIDGELVLDITGVTFSTTGGATQIQLPYSMTQLDDIWVKSDHDYFMEAQILALFPDGAGSYTDFMPVGESSNYLNVDEFEQDFDSTYNYGVSGDKDSFAFMDLDTTGDVHALVVRVFAKGEAGNADELRPFVIVGGNKYNGTSQLPSEVRYGYIQHIWDINPDTSVSWTVSDINAIQIGYEVM